MRHPEHKFTYSKHALASIETFSASMSGEGGERRALERSISSHSSMETDTVPQRARGSNQRMPPSEHTVQLPDVPYDEVGCALPILPVLAYSQLWTVIILYRGLGRALSGCLRAKAWESCDNLFLSCSCPTSMNTTAHGHHG